jgi:hypothetical protein
VKPEAIRPRILVATTNAMVGDALCHRLDGAGYRAVGPFSRTHELIPFTLDRTLTAAIIPSSLVDGPTRLISEALSRRDIRTIIYDPSCHGGTLLAPIASPRARRRAEIDEVCSRLVDEVRYLQPPSAILGHSAGGRDRMPQRRRVAVRLLGVSRLSLHLGMFRRNADPSSE